ncbi:hypothetical protein sscle_11g084640 [Sclerotinia sclerotiorum 1980 UF-70]|uniref:Nuclear RNA binding protein n=2 Tax=Sclerotinia sclerotiorum (strain ATCC 18683 / 1980 / Ss-1) TaxID=665079 RepID=A0A1D9QFH8_SCLS1|nr:hypothetical protein sscle_11g084640 [Sclerotinia sclerotiorum 1980 UF-70]
MASYKTPRRQSMDHPMDESPFDDRTYSIDSKTGSKRLYSDRNARPTILVDDGEGGKYLGPAFDHDEEYPDGKRHRSENWPLPPEPVQQGNPPPRNASRARSRTSHRSRRSTASPSPARPNLHRSRPSRFLEGSMNDKVSKIPPTPYLFHEEELRERYIEDELMGRNDRATPGTKMWKQAFMQHSNKSMGAESSLAAMSDTSRQSSIFRFGSKLAASIKPSNWKIFSKPQKIVEETPQQRAVRERQEKAEKMYHELKANGFFRDGAIVQQPGFRPLRHSMDQAPRFKHDSGVELNDKYHSRENSPMEDKRQARPVTSTQDFYHDSPASKFSAPVGASTPQSVFHRKTPSMSNLRKMTSREWMSRPALPEHSRSVRKVPSRKEFQRQQKLVKRVSDLETKLEDARRQLTETFAEPLAEEQIYQPPDFQQSQSHQPSYQQPYHQQASRPLPPPSDRYGRTRFVPGALATLPSERLLSGYVDPEANFNNDEDYHNIGKAITTRDSMDHISTGPTDLFKTNQLRSVQAGQASTTVPEEGSEYVLSSIESDTDMSDSYHPQGFITGGSAAGAKMAVEVKSTTSRVLSQQASVEEAKAGRPRAIKKKKIAEKDSAFRPTPESESDSDHDIIPLKKVRSSRTRKLINEKSPYTGPSTPEKRVVSDNARNPTARHPAPGHETERPRSILVKLRIPKDAPPAKTDGDFLSYTKPRESLSQQSQYNADDREPISANDFYGAPPVPRIPQHVRLPSGEMLHTRNSRPQRTQTTKEPGDWPEDLEIF